MPRTFQDDFEQHMDVLLRCDDAHQPRVLHPRHTSRDFLLSALTLSNRASIIELQCHANQPMQRARRLSASF
jgi:hypothetical protein